MDDRWRYCVRCADELVSARIDGRDRGRCPSCGWIAWDHAVPVVLVLAGTSSGKVVLTRDSRFPAHKWGLVAGYIERGETVEQAALRELEEEAGVIGRYPRVVGADVLGDNVIVCVACEIDDGGVTTDGQSDNERAMGTHVELVVPDLDRIVPDSPASRFIARWLLERH
jgi:8-oxo-dGTP pyrophosphatase MutT (NUDIX family)